MSKLGLLFIYAFLALSTSKAIASYGHCDVSYAWQVGQYQMNFNTIRAYCNPSGDPKKEHCLCWNVGSQSAPLSAAGKCADDTYQGDTVFGNYPTNSPNQPRMITGCIWRPN